MILNPHEYSQLVCGKHEYCPNRLVKMPRQVSGGGWHYDPAKDEISGLKWAACCNDNDAAYEYTKGFISSLNTGILKKYRFPNPDELKTLFEIENIYECLDMQSWENVWSVPLTQEWIDKGHIYIMGKYSVNRPLFYNIPNKMFDIRSQNDKTNMRALAVC